MRLLLLWSRKLEIQRQSWILDLLVKDGLHFALTRAQEANIFVGVSISVTEMSHLLNVDDVMILADWDPENAKRIIQIIISFYMVSSLRINLHKNKLMRVGVSYNQIVEVANRIGCAPVVPPLFHLGISVGQIMSQITTWIPLFDRFQSRLLGWKAKHLSIGGRLTLVKYDVDIRDSTFCYLLCVDFDGEFILGCRLR